MNFIRIQNTLINLDFVEEIEAQSRCTSIDPKDKAYFPALNVRFQGRQELFVFGSTHQTTSEAVQAAIDYLTKAFNNHNESSSSAS